jgi:hypothetical protein
MNMQGLHLKGLLLLCALPLLAACDTESRSACEGPNLGLDGAWFGAMEDDDGTLFTMEWRICRATITREIISGFASGVTGTLRNDGGGQWSGTLSDGTEFRMLTDPARSHATVITDWFEFAVLERHAAALPRYFFDDLDGNWVGRHARLAWPAMWVQEAWMACGAGLCTSNEAGGISASLDFEALDRDFGAYRGHFHDSLGEQGIAGALMSPDLMFLGTYTCPYDYRGPEDCTFGALRFD